MPRHNHLPTPEQVAVLAARHAAGEGLVALASEVRLSHARLRSLMVTAGGAIARRGPRQVRSDAELAAMAAAYQGGLTAEEASATGGISNDTLLAYMKKAGLPIREKHAACYRDAVNPDCFARIESEAAAYWLGFLFTNGPDATDCRQSPPNGLQVRRFPAARVATVGR